MNGEVVDPLLGLLFDDLQVQICLLYTSGYLKDAQGRATAAGMKVDFSAANTAAQRFASAGEAVHKLQLNPPSGVALAGLNFALRDAESALLNSCLLYTSRCV